MILVGLTMEPSGTFRLGYYREDLQELEELCNQVWAGVYILLLQVQKILACGNDVGFLSMVGGVSLMDGWKRIIAPESRKESDEGVQAPAQDATRGRL